MKKYGGEDFLNRLYKDLVHSDEVKHTAKGANKNEDLAIYLGRLERITNKARNKDRLELLKYFYYKKYIIKEENVPESYFKAQEQLLFERGYGYVKYDDETKKDEITSIISEQKASFDAWLDYLVSEDTKQYPMWFKYYVFQNIIKIGYFDKEKNEFTKRTNSTIKPFIEINREAIAMLYDELYKCLDKQNINDEQLEKLIKNGSFLKIYSYIIRKLDETKKIESNGNEGIWKKYEQGSNPKILFNDIHGKGTGWCTAGGLETASSHLSEGDFYVYYTKDGNGEYTNPRIAIRMEYDKIAEVRGIAENQNIENDMETIVEEKLREFPDKEEYKKKVNDMKWLTKIYNKHTASEKLTKEELRFLYELDDEIIGFGYRRDPRIDQILKDRNIKHDLAYVFDVTEDKIALTQKEAMEGNKRYYFGSFGLGTQTTLIDFVFPEEISNNLDLDHLKIIENVVFPKKVGGYLDLRKIRTINSLILPKKVGGDLNLDNLISGKGLILPEKVGLSLDLSNLVDANGLVFPKEVGCSLLLNNLLSAKNVTLPEKVGNDIILNSLTSCEGLILPKEIGKDLNLKNITNANGLIFPETIGGDLDLEKITTHEGLILPKKVGGDLNLSHLTFAEGLILPEEVGLTLNLSSLISSKGITFPKVINGNLYLTNLTEPEDLLLPKEINGSLVLKSLINIDNLMLPEIIEGDLDLSGLISVSNCKLPQEIYGDLNLKNLLVAQELIMPKYIDGNLNLSKLVNAANLILPEKIEGKLTLKNIVNVEGLVLPKEVGDDLDLRNLTNAKGLVFPEIIEGDLDLCSLLSAEGLELPDRVEGNLILEDLEEINGLDLPSHVGGDLYLSSLTKAEGLALPQEIGEDLDLSNLTSCEGIILPKNEQGEFYVPGSVLYCEFTREELIEAAKRTEENQMKLNRTKS